MIGPEQASVTIGEHGELASAVCGQALPAVKRLRGFFAPLRFASRHFPWETLHPHAARGADAMGCAGTQRQSRSMHDLLFAKPQHLKQKHVRPCRLVRRVAELARPEATLQERASDHRGLPPSARLQTVSRE